MHGCVWKVGTAAVWIALAVLVCAWTQDVDDTLQRIGAFALSGPTAAPVAYLADAGSQAIFVLQLTDGEGRFPTASAKRIFASPQFKRIAALGVRRRNLLICEGALAALYELDLETRQLSLLIWGAPLVAPTDLATSDQGEIAIADPGAGGIVFVGAGERPTLRTWSNISHPTRVRIEGRQFVLIENGNRLFEASIDRPESAARLVPLAKSDDPATSLPVIRSMSLFQGVRYLTTGRSVLVTALNDRKPFEWSPVELASEAEPAATVSTRISGDRFIVAHGQPAVLDVVRRVIPAQFTFDMEPQASRAAIVGVYRYLLARHALPTIVAKPTAATEKLEQWLIAQNVLLGPFESSARSAADFTQLLCELNPQACASRPLALDRKTDPLTELRIPNVQLTPFIATDRVDLKSKSAFAFVTKQFEGAHLRTVVNITNLWALNNITLEAEFGRQDLTLATPARNDLRPGTIITYRGGVEQVIGKDPCGFGEDAVESEPAFVPDGLVTADARPYLPRSDVVKPSPYHAKLSYIRPRLERLLPQQAAGVTLGKCAAMISTNAYLISSAIRVDGIRVHAVSESGDGSGIQLDQPLYIAYGAVPISQSGLPTMRPMNSALLKPDGPQNVLKWTGELNLPVLRWNADALIDVREYRDKNSALGALQTNFPGLLVLSAESLTVKQQSTDDPSSARVKLQASLQAIRQPVLDAIGYDREIPVTNAVISIGISEAMENVVMKHPGFVDVAANNAWWYTDDTGNVKQFVGAAATDEPELLPKKAPDHGTHVGGIIGARRNSLLPGLLPLSKLVLVAPTGNAALYKAITAARNDNVTIFNFSFSVTPTATTSRDATDDLSKLKGTIRRNVSDALFVVAAGNDGLDLAKAAKRDLPISWLTEEPGNMIGVAAAKGTREQGKLSWELADLSNYRKRWAQIAAPGDEVVSLAGPASFGQASGTSEAAPQVAAAAAMIVAQQPDLPPRIVKGRLLYTATWWQGLEGSEPETKVWAGLLNVRKAATNLKLNMVARMSKARDSDVLYAVDLLGSPEIMIKDAELDKLDLAEPVDISNVAVSFKDILRIEYQRDKAKWRVFYFAKENDEWHLRLANHARLSGTLTCTALSSVDADGILTKAPISDDVCAQGLDVGQIADYVAGIDRIRRPFSFF
jgi:hypothetical protein